MKEHLPYERGVGTDRPARYCRSCGQPWPCSTDLQRQLREAQEELKRAQTAHLRSLDQLHNVGVERNTAQEQAHGLYLAFHSTQAERDVAIAQGKVLWNALGQEWRDWFHVDQDALAPCRGPGGEVMIAHWGVLWHSKNRVDGETREFMWHDGHPALFRTRQLARDWIRERYGYIAHRRDLRAEPHGWRIPKAVRVRVTLTPVEACCSECEGYDG